MTLASLALDGANLAHAFQFTLEPRDPFLDAATIDFQLRFPRTAGADAASLSRQVTPHSGQARQQILQLRELDLQSALTTSRALGEDVENELGAIEDFAREQIF